MSGLAKGERHGSGCHGSSDQSVAEAFAERTLQIINDGALALMMSVGHRTGLFDTMADTARVDARRNR